MSAEFSMPRLGEPFPKIEANTTHGKIVIPDDFKGKRIVLFSHPADFTPVCTTEFVSFQKHKEEFDKLNVQLIGLSIDQVFSHIKRVERIEQNLGVKIEFPIIADDTGRIARMLGMIHPAKGTNTVRAVFIIDDKGILRAILYYPQEVGRNIKEILRLVKALQTSDKYGVALPANRPENELIGDKAIVPPAASVQEKEERLKAKERGEIECYDRRFCYKKLE